DQLLRDVGWKGTGSEQKREQQGVLQERRTLSHEIRGGSAQCVLRRAHNVAWPRLPILWSVREERKGADHEKDRPRRRRGCRLWWRFEYSRRSQPCRLGIFDVAGHGHRHRDRF